MNSRAPLNRIHLPSEPVNEPSSWLDTWPFLAFMALAALAIYGARLAGWIV